MSDYSSVSSSSISNSTSGLSSYFINIINNVLTDEAQPLQTMSNQKDSLNVQLGAYTQIKTQLTGLQNAVRGLISTDAFSDMNIARSIKVTPDTANTTVASATATSTAVTGDYNISNVTLAKAQRKVSEPRSSATQPAGKSGLIYLGGTGTASVNEVSDPDNVVTASPSTLSKDVRELGSGTYRIQTRISDGTLQFRLFDADGNAVAINSADGSQSSGWESVTNTQTPYDTGRGLTLSFDSGNAGANATVDYTAAGTSILVNSQDSLVDIAGKINSSSQPTGHDVVATVVGTQIVFTSAHTGDAHDMFFTDNSGLGFTEVQASSKATFTINNVTMSRQSNNNLTDAIAGVTLNLAPDAEGNNATVTVNPDLTNITNAINSFVTNFNSVQTFISDQTSVTQTDQNTYSRGALADDNVFSDLRGKLFDMAMTPVSTSGMYKSLSDIGITIDNNLQLSVSDSTKLNAALTNHYSDVTAILDSIMSSMNSTLQNYTASSGFVSTAITSAKSTIKDVDTSMQDFNTYLLERQNDLITQFAEMQATLMMLSYTQQTLTSLYGSTSTIA